MWSTLVRPSKEGDLNLDLICFLKSFVMFSEKVKGPVQPVGDSGPV